MHGFFDFVLLAHGSFDPFSPLAKVVIILVLVGIPLLIFGVVGAGIGKSKQRQVEQGGVGTSLGKSKQGQDEQGRALNSLA